MNHYYPMKIPGWRLVSHYATPLFLTVATRIFEAIKIDAVSRPCDHTQDAKMNNVSSYTIIDDRYAAQRFAELMGDDITCHESKIYIRGDDGYWRSDKNAYVSAILKHHRELVFRQEGKIHNYGGGKAKSLSMLFFLPHIVKHMRVESIYETFLQQWNGARQTTWEMYSSFIAFCNNERLCTPHKFFQEIQPLSRYWVCQRHRKVCLYSKAPLGLTGATPAA